MTSTADADIRRRLPPAVRLGLWGTVALGVALVRNGLWGTPNLPFFAVIAQRWGSNPFPKGLDGDYLLTNLLGPTIARVLGQTEAHSYARLHLVGLVAGLGVVVAAAYRRLGYRGAVVLTWVLAASPALSVCMQWLGQPDPWTLCLALALPLCTRRPTAFAVAVLLGLSHPEQGAIVAMVTAALPFAGWNPSPDGRTGPATTRWQPIAGWAATYLLGVVTGRALTQAYLTLNHIEVSRPRTSYLCLGIDGFLEHHLTSPIALIYSLWGPLWLLVGLLAWRGRRDPATRWTMAIAAAALVPVFFTLDETRVYALTTAPLLVVLAQRIGGLEVPRIGRRRLAAAATAGIVALGAIPGMFNAGHDYWAPALAPTEFVRFLTDGTVPGGVERTGTWLLAPFGFTVPPSC